jgi:hypothetical protein
MVKIVKPLKFTGFNNEDAYLLLISPHEIPHLVLLNKGKYFSLTYKKSVIAENFDAYLEFLKKNKKKIIFFQLRAIKPDIEKAFQEFKSVNTTAVTCLIPIRNHLLPASKAKYVFELVPELYQNKEIKAAYQLNMEDVLDENGDFELNEYTVDDIFSYIKKLKDRHAERN